MNGVWPWLAAVVIGAAVGVVVSRWWASKRDARSMEFGRLKIRLRLVGGTAQSNDQWRTGEALFTPGHLTFESLSLVVVAVDESLRRPATAGERAGLDSQCSVLTLGTDHGPVELVVPDKWSDWAFGQLQS